MGYRQFLLVCATLLCFYLAAITAQEGGGTPAQAPRTRFRCNGRPAGYYADVDTGCQVYHMCDGLGRQFSYTCPNTTLFQQRMLICDHWYMVNCSMSERDYSANLLIGQRDKPFVSEAEMRLRTPRPDILSVPLNGNYYDGLREAETKFSAHPGNSIVGIPDSISNANNNGLDSEKTNYRPPTSWSTGRGRPSVNSNLDSDAHEDTIKGAASQRPNPTIQSTPDDRQFVPVQPTVRSIQTFPDSSQATPPPPSQEFLPPFPPTTEAGNQEIDIRMKEDPVINFINRFDPNSPDSIKTAMTKTEILSINQQLPPGQSSAEDDRTPRKNKNSGNDFNSLQTSDKGFVDSRFDSVNLKPPSTEATASIQSRINQVPTPVNELLPPKRDFSEQPLTATTEGPAVYYEWKWAAPAFDLEPPKESNETASVAPPSQGKRNVSGLSPFSKVTRPPPIDLEPEPPTKNTEYNISSYFVPDYVFPLDKSHPGYEDENAETSFRVKIARPGRASYGENPACPHCHPAYLNPGTCEPCIVKR